MDNIRDRFHAARREMINAIAELTTLALRAGVDDDAIGDIQGRFFDGNVELKKVFRLVLLLAEIRRPDSSPASSHQPAAEAVNPDETIPKQDKPLRWVM